jgi:tetratricopeptide (TPR) repeat protein
LLAAFAQKLIHVGRPEEGLKMVEKAIRLHPYYQAWIHRLLVSAYYYAGRYDKAITGAKEYLDRDPKRVSPRIILVASLVAAGREEEAREEAEKFVELHPKWSISRKARNKRSHFVRFKDPEHWERLANRLHQAGVTE